MTVIKKIKELFAFLLVWTGLKKEETCFDGSSVDQDILGILFIDSLYVRGVEDYAFDRKKNAAYYKESEYYRKGWDDFETYAEKVNPKTKDEALAFLKEYTTGVSCAYAYGRLFYKSVAETLAEESYSNLSRHAQRSAGCNDLWDKRERANAPEPFFGTPTKHMEKGFDNGMFIMNKQETFMKTDPAMKRMREVSKRVEANVYTEPTLSEIGTLAKS